MRSFIRVFIPLVTLLGILPPQPCPAQQTQAASPVLGYWHGESICVKATWNAACNDEEAFYEFVPSAVHRGGVLLHAAKMADGTIVPMGDLEFTLDTTSGRWTAEYRNARVHIQWSFELRGEALTGELIDLPSRRLLRRVAVQRAAAFVPGSPSN